MMSILRRNAGLAPVGFALLALWMLGPNPDAAFGQATSTRYEAADEQDSATQKSYIARRNYARPRADRAKYRRRSQPAKSSKARHEVSQAQYQMEYGPATTRGRRPSSAQRSRGAVQPAYGRGGMSAVAAGPLAFLGGVPWQQPQSRPVRPSRYAYYQAPTGMPRPPMQGSGPMVEEVEPDIAFDAPMDGEVVWEGEPSPWVDGPVEAWEGGECADCYGPYPHYHPWGCGLFAHHPWFENLTLYAGSHAFTGPPDRGMNGNFGFQEGFNWGAPLPLFYPLNLGWQFGVQAFQSGFEGNNALGTFSPETRDQVFITAGIFHRPLYRPFQWGVVADWMQDDFYVKMSLAQVRAELSLLGPYGNEVGFWGAFATSDDEALLVQNNTTTLVNWEANDIYAFFFRRRFEQSQAELRIWGGFTGASDGIFGGDFRVPISDWIALQGGGNYLASEETKTTGGVVEDSWGAFVNVVWYPARSARHATRSPYRPLFNVADPSVFMVEALSGP